MISIWKTKKNVLKELTLDTLEKGSWIHIENPTNEEIKNVAEICGVPFDFIGNALDDEERSRIEIEDDSLLVIANTPVLIDENNCDTRPLGIVVTIDYFITVSREHCDVLNGFNPEKATLFDTNK